MRDENNPQRKPDRRFPRLKYRDRETSKNETNTRRHNHANEHVNTEIVRKQSGNAEFSNDKHKHENATLKRTPMECPY